CPKQAFAKIATPRLLIYMKYITNSHEDELKDAIK
ncbi:hypothetical protein BMETH_29561953001724, partial [methanotrophic bacterial endosymbiont of Bathymodiolus sp.]